MDEFLKLLAVLALVLANGFFVAAEFALVSVRRTRVEELVSRGNRTARVVRRALRLAQALGLRLLGHRRLDGLGGDDGRRLFGGGRRLFSDDRLLFGGGLGDLLEGLRPFSGRRCLRFN